MAATMDAKKPLEEIDYFDGEFLRDPYSVYERLRTEAPVYRDPKNGVVYVSTYDLVKEVCRRTDDFSSKFGHLFRSSGEDEMDPEVAEILKEGIVPVDTLQTADPPNHAPYRRVAQQAFNYKRILQMEDYIATVTNGLIDGFIEDGQCEFKSQFGDELPMIVIADALGVPRDNIPTFRKWSRAFISQLGGLADKAGRIEAARLTMDFQKYFIARLEERRENPGEDLVSVVATTKMTKDGESRLLTISEALGMVNAFLVAGNETTAHSLTAGIYYLLSHPDQLAQIQKDESLIPNFIEEALRMLTPTNNMWRIAARDTELGGVAIKKGERVLIRFGSANRDEKQFENGDVFDVSREGAKQHMAFGAGIHVCLGEQLARKELSTAFPILIKRLKNMRFAEGKNTFRFAPNFLLRGVEQLHIEFDPGKRVAS